MTPSERPESEPFSPDDTRPADDADAEIGELIGDIIQTATRPDRPPAPEYDVRAAIEKGRRVRRIRRRLTSVASGVAVAAVVAGAVILVKPAITGQPRPEQYNAADASVLEAKVSQANAPAVLDPLTKHLSVGDVPRELTWSSREIHPSYEILNFQTPPILLPEDSENPFGKGISVMLDAGVPSGVTPLGNGVETAEEIDGKRAWWVPLVIRPGMDPDTGAYSEPGYESSSGTGALPGASIEPVPPSSPTTADSAADTTDSAITEPPPTDGSAAPTDDLAGMSSSSATLQVQMTEDSWITVTSWGYASTPDIDEREFTRSVARSVSLIESPVIMPFSVTGLPADLSVMDTYISLMPPTEDYSTPKQPPWEVRLNLTDSRGGYDDETGVMRMFSIGVSSGDILMRQGIPIDSMSGAKVYAVEGSDYSSLSGLAYTGDTVTVDVSGVDLVQQYPPKTLVTYFDSVMVVDNPVDTSNWVVPITR